MTNNKNIPIYQRVKLYILELINDEARKEVLQKNIKAMAKPNAAGDIVEEIVKLIA